MIFVGARLHGHAHVPAGAEAELRVHAVLLDGDLLHGIHRGRIGAAGIHADRHAVQQQVVPAAGVSSHVYAVGGLHVEGVTVRYVPVAVDHRRVQQHQGERIPGQHWQVGQHFARHCLCHGGGIGFQRHCRFRHLHRLSNCAHRELAVDGNVAPRQHGDIFLRERIEAGHLHPDGVVPGRHEVENEMARHIGAAHVLNARADVLQRDFSAGHRGPGLIRAALHTRPVILAGEGQ